MGQKKRRKRKNRKYNKSQFIDIVCHHCGLCGKHPNPTFCYGEIYSKNPKVFMDRCYIRLVNVGSWSEDSTTLANFTSIQEFREIFCCSGVCDNKYMICNNKYTTCKDILICYDLFRRQIKKASISYTSKKGKKRKKPKDSPYIFEAYPTFFLSSDREWKDEVEGILKNENRNF